MTSLAPAAVPARAPATAWLALGVLVLVWGSGFLFMKIALEALTPAALAFARILLGAAAAGLAAVTVARGARPDRRLLIWGGFVGALGVAAPINAVSVAIETVPSGVVGVYMAAVPLFVLPLAHVFVAGETLTWRKGGGFLVGFAGVLTLLGWENVARLGSADLGGQALCLLAALCFAIGSISIRLAPKSDPITFTALQLAAATVISAPFGACALPSTLPPNEVLAALAIVGVLGTGFAIMLRVHVVTTAGPSFMSIAGFLIPLVALFLGWMFAGETVGPRELGACALILGGVAIARTGARRPNQP